MKNGFTPLEIPNSDGQNNMDVKKTGQKKSLTGFTFIEMMVAVSIFVLMVSASSGVFISNLKVQKRSLAYQELFDQTSYIIDYMSRALRMARKDIDGSCTGAAKLNYSFLGQCLNFRSYRDTCQQFCLEGTRLKDAAGNYLTSGNLQVRQFRVNLEGSSQEDNRQPEVTFFLEVAGKESSLVKLQTTISQRNADVRK